MSFIIFIIIGFIALFVMINNVYKDKFSEKESFFWAVAGLIMVTSPLYIDLVSQVSYFVGIHYPPSLVFALVIIFIFFLIYRLSAAAHKQNENLVELIQLNAIYEHELRKLNYKIEKNDLKCDLNELN